MDAGAIISMMISVIVGIISMMTIKGMVESIDVSKLNPLEAAMITQIMPILAAIAIIMSTLAMTGGAESVTRILKWNAFGNRLKAAYSAKFGGDNKGFDDEVDEHIKAVKALGKGFTKSIDVDWLKRMAKFVEIPFVIPEEEYRSEEEKTKDFDNG